MSGIYSYDSVDSTNNVARRMIDIFRNNDIIWAISQTKGHGKGERTWHSPKGGLWFSVIFKPQRLCKDPNIYTKLASVAIIHVLKRMKIGNVGVKWPNDIYHGKKKVGGILTEIFSQGSEHAVVIGIGLNVNNQPPHEVKNATSLFEITGKKISVSQLLNMISSEMKRIYNLVTSGKRNVVTNLWRNAMIVKRGTKVKVFDITGRNYLATVVKILSDSLIVEHNGVKERVHPSEISFL